MEFEERLKLWNKAQALIKTLEGKSPIEYNWNRISYLSGIEKKTPKEKEEFRHRINFQNGFTSLNEEEVETINEDLILFFIGGVYETTKVVVSGGLNGG